ncbi:hypothetical protein AB0M46_34960 [Dactylosporangium sp. NPDC051485]|uniref:hypothetical protein n=1 Tax=Dactylosporangium sp. NPDC051485 TaxID=3154846 RepID=UPI003422D690
MSWNKHPHADNLYVRMRVTSIRVARAPQDRSARHRRRPAPIPAKDERYPILFPSFPGGDIDRGLHTTLVFSGQAVAAAPATGTCAADCDAQGPGPLTVNAHAPPMDEVDPSYVGYMATRLFYRGVDAANAGAVLVPSGELSGLV